jgi:Alginate export
MKATLNRLLSRHAAYALAAPVILLGTAANAETADSLSEMISKGDASANFRYRYENVDQDAIDKSSSASTLRSRLTLTTAAWQGLSGKLEVDNVWGLGADNYNSTENGQTDRPVIADPTGTSLNQLWLQYASDAVEATAGRQRILHGNQRFVGGVAWRQNEQTYDGLRVKVDALDNLSIDASYVYEINRIFGPDDGANPAQLSGDNFLLRADYKPNEQHSLAAYAYLLDIDDDSPYSDGRTVNNSSDTYGIEYSGKFDQLTINAAIATQSEGGDSDLDYDANYANLELGYAFEKCKFNVGYEVLAAGDDVGFKTPLATGHKFQGWADQFPGTPPDGVEDMYAGVSTQLGPVKVQAVYHDFQAEDSSEDFGTETDLSLTWKVYKDVSLQAKFAHFESDSDRYTDTDKFWFVAQYSL